MAAQQMFIALQCFQCSTMQARFGSDRRHFFLSLPHLLLLLLSLLPFACHCGLPVDQVKQQKRSSNKWVCAVCNQKQSLRKVFARACLARDVRSFVQRFNMSRATTDEPDSAAPAQIGTDVGADRANCHRSSPLIPNSRARTDWSQYLDPNDEAECVDDASTEAVSSSPEVVTEMPTEMLRQAFPKRPRNLRFAGGKDDAFKNRKQEQSPQLQEMCDQKRRLRVVMAGPSKWSEYLLQEDSGENAVGKGMDFSEPVVSWCPDGDGHGRCNDVRVEDEVHPDFL